MLVRADLSKQPHLANDHNGAGHENDPTFEIVQEAFRCCSAPVLYHYPDYADSKAVHEDRNGNSRQEDDRALPQRPLEEIRSNEPEGH